MTIFVICVILASIGIGVYEYGVFKSAKNTNVPRATTTRHISKHHHHKSKLHIIYKSRHISSKPIFVKHFYTNVGYNMHLAPNIASSTKRSLYHSAQRYATHYPNKSHYIIYIAPVKIHLIYDNDGWGDVNDIAETTIVFVNRAKLQNQNQHYNQQPNRNLVR